MSNFKAEVLLYPKRIQSFCESNLIILKFLMLISLVSSVIDRDGKEYCESYAKGPWTIEISNLKNLHHSFYS